MTDPVNHPAHYTSDAQCSSCGHPIECIDITKHLMFNPGNAIKYVWRAGAKGKTIEDLKKAIWYITCEIDRLSEKSQNEIPEKSKKEKLEKSKSILEKNKNKTVYDNHPDITADCIVCLGTLHWQECPTGGWWIHERHPDDNHLANAGYAPRQQMDDDGNIVTVW